MRQKECNKRSVFHLFETKSVAGLMQGGTDVSANLNKYLSSIVNMSSLLGNTSCFHTEKFKHNFPSLFTVKKKDENKNCTKKNPKPKVKPNLLHVDLRKLERNHNLTDVEKDQLKYILDQLKYDNSARSPSTRKTKAKLSKPPKPRKKASKVLVRESKRVKAKKTSSNVSGRRNRSRKVTSKRVDCAKCTAGNVKNEPGNGHKRELNGDTTATIGASQDKLLRALINLDPRACGDAGGLHARGSDRKRSSRSINTVVKKDNINLKSIELKYLNPTFVVQYNMEGSGGSNTNTNTNEQDQAAAGSLAPSNEQEPAAAGSLAPSNEQDPAAAGSLAPSNDQQGSEQLSAAGTKRERRYSSAALEAHFGTNPRGLSFSQIPTRTEDMGASYLHFEESEPHIIGAGRTTQTMLRESMRKELKRDAEKYNAGARRAGQRDQSVVDMNMNLSGADGTPPFSAPPEPSRGDRNGTQQKRTNLENSDDPKFETKHSNVSPPQKIKNGTAEVGSSSKKIESGRCSALKNLLGKCFGFPKQKEDGKYDQDRPKKEDFQKGFSKVTKKDYVRIQNKIKSEKNPKITRTTKDDFFKGKELKRDAGKYNASKNSKRKDTL